MIFTPGDEVVDVRDGQTWFVEKINYTKEFYTVVKYANNTQTSTLKSAIHRKYLILKEDYMKKEFDMHKSPWFIRVNNQNEFNAVREWIYSKGFNFQFDDFYDETILAIGCTRNNSRVNSESLIRLRHEELPPYCKSFLIASDEIKLDFKLVVYNITYPEVKSEAEKELEKLEEQIKQLQIQGNKLKETIK